MECGPPILDEAPSTAPDQLNIGAGPAAGGGDLGVPSGGNSVLCEGGGTEDREVWGEGVAGDVTLWGALLVTLSPGVGSRSLSKISGTSCIERLL